MVLKSNILGEKSVDKKEQLIKKNIIDIHVGEVFKSERSLIKILLELNQISGGRNKESYVNYIKQYLDYEKTGRNAYEIRITEIYDEKKEKQDGRKNNKGGNNHKYIDYIVPLMQDYGTAILTSEQIVQRIFGMDYSMKGGTAYQCKLSMFLKGIIPSPCKKVGGNPNQIYMISPDSKYENLALEIEWDKVTLWDVLQFLNRKSITKDMFKCGLEAVGILDINITVIDFVEFCIKNNIDAHIEAFVGDMIPSRERVLANADMTQAIDHIKQCLYRYYKVKGNYQYTNEREKGKNIPKVEKTIYRILGWQGIYKAWDIVVKEPIKLSFEEKQYYKRELKELFQEKMEKFLMKKYSSYIYREKRFGRLPDGNNNQAKEAKKAFELHKEIFGDSQYIDYFTKTFGKEKHKKVS